MIRIANEADIDRVLKITKNCAKHMIKNNIYQWNEHYPSRTSFEKDIERKELFLIENDKLIIGCVVISTFMDDVYKPVRWLTSNANNIYIHRLAIDPEFQGKGYAQKLMDFAERYAIDNCYTSIRLDTFSKNKRNQKFYEIRGYKRLEEIYFPKQSEFPFYCYELVF